METLFERHLEYLSDVPISFERELMKTIDWDSRLILIRGPKGVGKSTLMLQYILKNYGVSDRHVLYCSADTGYFTTHTLVDTAAAFVRQGGTHLFIDEIHKYDGWSTQIKEIYDLFKHLKVVLSGSSLIQLNDGKADLSRRQDIYDMPGLSFREYLWFRTGKEIAPVTFEELSKSVGIDRVTLLRYMKHLAEAKLTRNIYAIQDTITDLQKPDKLMLDNTNQIFSLCSKVPEIGTIRECFFCNQLASAGYKVEYGGMKTSIWQPATKFPFGLLDSYTDFYTLHIV